jgi:hypothetical protein
MKPGQVNSFRGLPLVLRLCQVFYAAMSTFHLTRGLTPPAHQRILFWAPTYLDLPSRDTIKDRGKSVFRNRAYGFPEWPRSALLEVIAYVV